MKAEQLLPIMILCLGMLTLCACNDELAESPKLTVPAEDAAK